MQPIKRRCHRARQPKLGVNPSATLVWGGVCRPTLSNWGQCQWAHQSMQGLWLRVPLAEGWVASPQDPLVGGKVTKPICLYREQDH